LSRLVGYMRGYKLILARLNGNLVPGLPHSVHLPASETPLITNAWYPPLQHTLRIPRAHDNHVKDELPFVMKGSKYVPDVSLSILMSDPGISCPVILKKRHPPLSM
jgi:hypothetical protein